MLRLYSAGSLAEAYLLLHCLTEAGIEAQVLNEHAQGGVGQLPFTHAYPEIWLFDPGDAERARKVIASYERNLSTPVAMRACAHCAEESPAIFELCWQCGAAFPP